jgi:hypothetical protein
MQARPLFEKVARREQVTTEERTRLQALMERDQWEDRGLVILAVWALWTLSDPASRGPIDRRYKRLPRGEVELFGDQHEWPQGALYLRLASLRLQQRSRPQAETFWEELLLAHDESLFRAEAARQVVTMGHPRAHRLLLEAFRAERARRNPSADVLIQIVTGLANYPAEDSDAAAWWLLWNGRGAANPPYSWILELDYCHTLMRPPCRGWRDYSVRESAARALEHLRPRL